ncbi:energy transducer TonB [uncultured Selenomonas sp.]|uniref:energy transducer TonB n=1 Tax=uncultured Selenomonas sp. TaxID=159275 RepID=UPI0028E7B5B0|nr:energy transducer TonB [uncultured Selenomonas sp.]
MKIWVGAILAVFFLAVSAASVSCAEEPPPKQLERITLGQPPRVLHFEHIQDTSISYEGYVVLVAHIDEQGHVVSTAITHSSGDGNVDLMACRVVLERWTFTPALDVDGRPMPCNVMCQVYFNMEPKHRK